MGRGGGVVAGSKHSVENEHHHSSGGGGGESNPFVMMIVLFFIGGIFLILTIVVPIVMVASPSGESCSPSKSLNRNEQMVCIPTDLKYKWIAEFENKGKDYAKVYRLPNGKNAETTIRKFTWYNYYARLKGTWDEFSFSVPLGCSGKFGVYCDGKKCDHLRLYLLNQKQFEESVDSNNEFHEKTYKYDFKDFEDEQVNWFEFSVSGPDSWHLIFSNNKNKAVEIVYSIELDYSIYKTDGLEAQTCKDNKCTFSDMKDGEYILLDYPSATDSAYYGQSGSAPEYFSAKMHNNKISWGGVIAVIVIFGLITLACFLVGILFLLHVF